MLFSRRPRVAFGPGRAVQFGLRLARGLAATREVGPWVNATGIIPIANMVGLNRLPMVRDVLARLQGDVGGCRRIRRRPHR